MNIQISEILNEYIAGLLVLATAAILALLWPRGRRVLFGVPALLRERARAIVGIRDWRVSIYRRSPSTQNTLPSDTKSQLRFCDLNEAVRRELRIKDLPEDEKYKLLDKFILPKIYGSQTEGTLHLLDDRGRSIQSRDIKLIGPKDDFDTMITQSGMQIRFTFEFQDPRHEILFDADRDIGFEAVKQWRMVGRPRNSWQLCAGSRQVEIWIDYLRFDGLIIYDTRE